MKNLSIRTAAKSAGVPLWAVANEMGISDTTFYRRIRQELSATDTEKALAIIDRLAAEKASEVTA